jgi:SNF2 family DNA or RNA helicase
MKSKQLKRREKQKKKKDNKKMIMLNVIIINYEKLAEKLKLFGQTKTTNEYEKKNEEMMAINEKHNGRSIRDKSDNVTSFG